MKHAPAIKGYRVQRRVGQGRTCTAYLAHDLLRGGQVVLKVLHREHARDPARNQAFVQEFAIARLTRDRHVIRVFDQSIGERYSYIAMDYLDGGDLAAAIRRGLTPPAAVSLLEQAAAALAQLHRRGFVHCDVKPANLLLDSGGRLVLADFGLARRIGAVSPAARGTFIGSPCYAAPHEEGAIALPADDVYSLGVVFYEMLCGVAPFAGATPMEVYCQHLMAAVPRLPPPLAAFQSLIGAMLAKQAGRRPADGGALLDEIGRLKSHQAAAAGPRENRCLT